MPALKKVTSTKLFNSLPFQWNRLQRLQPCFGDTVNQKDNSFSEFRSTHPSHPMLNFTWFPTAAACFTPRRERGGPKNETCPANTEHSPQCCCNAITLTEYYGNIEVMPFASWVNCPAARGRLIPHRHFQRRVTWSEPNWPSAQVKIFTVWKKKNNKKKNVRNVSVKNKGTKRQQVLKIKRGMFAIKLQLQRPGKNFHRKHRRV